MNKKDFRFSVILVSVGILVLTMFNAMPVLAATFAWDIQLHETSNTTYANTPFMSGFKVNEMIASGYMQSDGLDAVVTDGGNALPTLVSDNAVWWVGDLASGTTKTFTLTTGNDPVSSMPIIVGHGGKITTAYNSTLEPSSGDFEIDFPGFIDTSYAADKYILRHDGEITIQIVNDGEIALTVYDGNTHEISVPSVPSAYYSNASLINTGGTWVFTAGTYQCTVAGVTTVPDNNAAWVWNENNAMPYIDSIVISQPAQPSSDYYISEFNIPNLASTGRMLALPDGIVPVSHSMCTDGTYLYILATDTNNNNDLTIQKYDLRDFSFVTSVTWTNGFNYGYYRSESIPFTNMMVYSIGYLYLARPLDVNDSSFRLDKISCANLNSVPYYYNSTGIRGLACDNDYVYMVSHSEGDWLEKLNQSDLTEAAYNVLSNTQGDPPTNFQAGWSVACGGSYVYVAGKYYSEGTSYIASFSASDLNMVHYETFDYNYSGFFDYQNGDVYSLQPVYSLDKYSDDLSGLIGTYEGSGNPVALAGSLYEARKIDAEHIYIEKINETTLTADTICQVLTTNDATINMITYYGEGGSHLYVNGATGSPSAGGELLHYQPDNIIQGTVLPDWAGNQDGVITWGTENSTENGGGGGSGWGNPPGDNPVVGGVYPITLAQVTSNSTGLANYVIMPEISSNFSTTIAPAFPGADIITSIANATDTPPQLPFIMLASFVVEASSLTGSYLQHKFMTNSIFIKILIVTGVMSIFVALKVFDFWMLVLYLIIAITIGLTSLPKVTSAP